jgi:hypothetical protein
MLLELTGRGPEGVKENHHLGCLERKSPDRSVNEAEKKVGEGGRSQSCDKRVGSEVVGKILAIYQSS